MNRTPLKQHHMDGLLTLLLFGIFAACVLSLLLAGAGVYRRLTLRDQAAYDRRTCVQYLAAKVRQAHGPDAVSLSPFGDGDALVLEQAVDGTPYVTRVYCYDGWLWELFSVSGETFSPEDGEKLLRADALSLTLEDGLLTLSVTDASGADSRLTLALRGGGEGAG